MHSPKGEGLSRVSIALTGAAVLAAVSAGLLLYLESHEAPPPPVPSIAMAAEPPATVTPETIRRSMLMLGFRDVRNVRQRGQHFSADALTGTGLEARVVIHGTTGAVLGIRVIEVATSTRLADTGRR
ncbi:MAG TPA: hypothetical protein PK812_07035 [Beijerinckiaceae bacterium]|nr:hypothetical protein [Beijerinckiaceae bacterium]